MRSRSSVFTFLRSIRFMKEDTERSRTALQVQNRLQVVQRIPLLRCLSDVFLTSHTDNQLWDWEKNFPQFCLIFRYFQQGLCDEENLGMPSPVLANSGISDTDISSVFFAFCLCHTSMSSERLWWSIGQNVMACDAWEIKQMILCSLLTLDF